MHVPTIRDQASGLTVSFGQNQRYFDLKEVNSNITWVTDSNPGTYWVEIGNPTEHRLEAVISVGGRDIRHGSASLEEEVRGIVLPEQSSWKCVGWLNDGALTRFCMAPGKPSTDILVTIYSEDLNRTEPPGESPEALPQHRATRANERFGVTKFTRGQQSRIHVRLASSIDKTRRLRS